jgi:hypothetical protein
LQKLTVRLVVDVWEQMRPKTNGEVIEDLAVLAKVDQEVNDEDQFFLVKELALFH